MAKKHNELVTCWILLMLDTNILGETKFLLIRIQYVSLTFFIFKINKKKKDVYNRGEGAC